jgi:hypothetical protein
MAGKAESISVSTIHEHQAGCADCGPQGRFEQTYALPNWWTAELLGHVAKANGVKAFIRKTRGAKTELVLKAHDARALEKTTESFFDLAEKLATTIQGTVTEFCRRVPGIVAEAK